MASTGSLRTSRHDMAVIEIKGLHTVRVGGRTYIYAWRGGPRVKGAPGTPAFLQSYNEAVEAYRLPETGKISSIVRLYRASDDFTDLAETTRRNWVRWLDRIDAYFGSLSVAQFDRPQKIRPVIRKWRDRYSHQPRAADYGMQVLSRVMTFAVDRGKIATNPCEGFKQLYANDRSDIIWSESDIERIKSVSSAELGWAFDLAAHTGLRQADLVRLSWSHVGEHAIEIPAAKSKRHNKRPRTAIIPIYADLRDLLDRIPRRATTILTNTRRRPWTTDGLGTSIQDAKEAAEMKGADLHFHDLRGNAATKFYVSGLPIRVIAEILAWEEAQVERIIRRYVGRQAATLEAIRIIDEAKARTNPVKTGVKPRL